MQEIKINETIDKRLDQYLSEVTDYSRSTIQKMIKDNDILVNGKTIKSSYNLKIGDLVTLEEPKVEELCAAPEKMVLDILYED